MSPLPAKMSWPAGLTGFFLLVDVKLTDQLSLSMNAEVVHSNGKYKFRYRRVTPSGELAYDTTAVRQNGDVNAVRVEAGLNYYYSNTGFWKMQAYHYNSERGVPGAIVNNVWRRGERLCDDDVRGNGNVWKCRAIDKQILSKLSAMRGRVSASASAKPYYSVRLRPGQSSVDCFSEIIALLTPTPDNNTADAGQAPIKS